MWLRGFGTVKPGSHYNDFPAGAPTPTPTWSLPTVSTESDGLFTHGE